MGLLEFILSPKVPKLGTKAPKRAVTAEEYNKFIKYLNEHNGGEVIKLGSLDYTELNGVSDTVYIKTVTDAKPINKKVLNTYLVITEEFANKNFILSESYNFVNGSATVMALSQDATADLVVGDSIKVSTDGEDKYGEILSINYDMTDTTIVLTSVYTGSTATSTTATRLKGNKPGFTIIDLEMTKTNPVNTPAGKYQKAIIFVASIFLCVLTLGGLLGLLTATSKDIMLGAAGFFLLQIDAAADALFKVTRGSNFDTVTWTAGNIDFYAEVETVA